jgi:hypothetical protein
MSELLPIEVERIELVKRHQQLGAIIDAATEEQELIKAKFRQLGIGHYDVGDVPVTVSPNRRFDPATAEPVLTAINPALVAACSETALSAKKAKLVLPPDLYAQCMKVSPNHKVQVG